MAKQDAMYGISRIDDDSHRTHAWRVSLRRRGNLIVKNFPDKKYGGKRKALGQAKLFRDETLLKYPPITRKQFCSILRRHNHSGIPGVYTYAKRYKVKNGTVKEIWYWEAHWPTAKGESEKATFSIQTHGEDKARKLAIQARKRGVDKLQGVFWASERGQIDESGSATASKAKPKVKAKTKVAAKKAKTPAKKTVAKAKSTPPRSAVKAKAPAKAKAKAVTKTAAKAAPKTKAKTAAKVKAIPKAKTPAKAKATKKSPAQAKAKRPSKVKKAAG